MDSIERRASFDAVFPTREQFLESCVAQEFSLPKPIMEYIWTNPSSPKVYEKLIKCCKLFFLKNPILVFKNLKYDEDGWAYCYAKKCDRIGHQHKNFDMELFDGKIWVKNELSVFTNEMSTVASDLIPKMYQSDIKILSLFYQILSYGELKFLASSGVVECRFGKNIVKYDNGEDVPLVEIIKLFSGAKMLSSVLADVPFNAACNSYADFLDACDTIKKVDLCSFSSDFDVRELYQQMKLSKSHVLISIHSWFNGGLYNGIVDQIAEEIFATESFDFVPPVITYVGQDEAKLKKMEEIHAREAAKYH